MVSSPGCSKTMLGLRRSPRISQIFLPKALALFVHVFCPSVSVQCGGTPQWLNSYRLIQPTAPSFLQYSPRSSLETTAIGSAPCT